MLLHGHVVPLAFRQGYPVHIFLAGFLDCLQQGGDLVPSDGSGAIPASDEAWLPESHLVEYDLLQLDAGY